MTDEQQVEPAEVNPYNTAWVHRQYALALDQHIAQFVEAVAINAYTGQIMLNRELIAAFALDAMATMFREIRVIKNETIRDATMDSLQIHVLDYLTSGKKPID